MRTYSPALLLLAASAALTVMPASAAPITSGDYDGLLVGVDKQGVLTAYYESSTGAGQFSCIFFMRGKVSEPATHIDTWFPPDRDTDNVISGTMQATSENGKPAVSARLKEDPPGCWNVQHFAAEPVSFRLAEQGSWQAIRIVSAKKAYFHDQPSTANRRKAYAVDGNALRVFETQPGWVNAEYVSPERKRTKGWIQERDLYLSGKPGGK
ncbi:hypothetical protein [Janthinobacterium sp. RB2R34]|uniref:hypothetical protein n=1 Tax=Janthinobacterium sp. RB2R34 TaxID=3424193 RepID=UPI003F21025C